MTKQEQDIKDVDLVEDCVQLLSDSEVMQEFENEVHISVDAELYRDIMKRVEKRNNNNFI